jgi:hypothetical protein
MIVLAKVKANFYLAFSNSKCSANCRKCYDSLVNTCYQCNTGYVLSKRQCAIQNGVFLKVPSLNNDFVNFNVTLGDNFNLEKFSRDGPVTFTIWVKMFGIMSTAKTMCPVIVQLSPASNFCYNTTAKAINYIDSNLQTADTSFNDYIGQWTFLSVALYQNNNSTLAQEFNSMLAVSIMQKELPMAPRNGLFSKMDSILLGYEVSALFYDIRVYRSFIVNAYKYVVIDVRTENLVFNKNLFNQTLSSSCLNQDDITNKVPTTVNCVADYFNNNSTFYSCQANDTSCLTSCNYNSDYYIRKDFPTSKSYCQRNLLINFSENFGRLLFNQRFEFDKHHYFKEQRTCNRFLVLHL